MSESITKNSLSGMATLFITSAIGLFSNILTLRILGPEQVGVFFIFISLNQFTAMIMSIGIPNANTMLLGKAKYSFNDVNNNTLLMSLLLGLMSIIIYMVLKPYLLGYIVNIHPDLVLLSILLVPFAIYANSWSGMLIGMNDITLLNKFAIAQGLASLFLLIVFLFFIRQDVYGAVIAWSLSVFISPIAMVLINNRRSRLRPSFNKRLFKESIVFGSQVHLGGIATMIWQRVDAFFLNYYHGNTSVGYYSLAVNLTEMLWRLTTPIGNAVNSTITGGEKNAAGHMTATVVRHITLLLTVLGGLLCISSPLIIRVMYGAEFLPSVKPLLILMAGTIAVGIVMITAIFFANTMNKPLFLSGLAWMNAAINIPLCIALIPRYAENGAALASTLTYTIGAMIILLKLKKELNIPIKNLLIATKDDLKHYAFLKDLFIRIVTRKQP